MQFGLLRLVLVLAAAGQLPAAASADSLPARMGSAAPVLIWTTPLVPEDSVDPPPPALLEVFADDRLTADASSPGLEFSVSPAEEEVFFGWRFAF